MNIKRYAGIAALWTVAACMQTAIAATPPAPDQGQASVAGTLRIDNKSSHKAVVTQGADIHPLETGKSIELPINGRDVAVTIPAGQGRIDRTILKFNPGNCAFPLCLEVH